MSVKLFWSNTGVRVKRRVFHIACHNRTTWMRRGARDPNSVIDITLKLERIVKIVPVGRESTDNPNRTCWNQLSFRFCSFNWGEHELAEMSVRYIRWFIWTIMNPYGSSAGIKHASLWKDVAYLRAGTLFHRTPNNRNIYLSGIYDENFQKRRKKQNVKIEKKIEQAKEWPRHFLMKSRAEQKLKVNSSPLKKKSVFTLQIISCLFEMLRPVIICILVVGENLLSQQSCSSSDRAAFIRLVRARSLTTKIFANSSQKTDNRFENSDKTKENERKLCKLPAHICFIFSSDKLFAINSPSNFWPAQTMPFEKQLVIVAWQNKFAEKKQEKKWKKNDYR